MNCARCSQTAAKDSRQKSFEWKSALPYVPSLLKASLAIVLGLLAYLGYRTAVWASFCKVRSVDVAGAIFIACPALKNISESVSEFVRNGLKIRVCILAIVGGDC